MALQQLDVEEHELPSVEALLAGSLALMTGYSQALQAELPPQARVRMGDRLLGNLAMLVDHPQLSLGFRQVLLGLHQRWEAMRQCTLGPAGDADLAAANATHPHEEHRPGWSVLAAPNRLQ